MSNALAPAPVTWPQHTCHRHGSHGAAPADYGAAPADPGSTVKEPRAPPGLAPSQRGVGAGPGGIRDTWGGMEETRTQNGRVGKGKGREVLWAGEVGKERKRYEGNRGKGTARRRCSQNSAGRPLIPGCHPTQGRSMVLQMKTTLRAPRTRVHAFTRT